MAVEAGEEDPKPKMGKKGEGDFSLDASLSADFFRGSAFVLELE